MNLGEPIATGNTAKIYLADNKIIKVFKDYLPRGEAEYEANKQKHAYLCGLRVPYVYDVTRIDGKQAIVMEYVSGKTIGDIINEDTSKLKYYLNLLVDVQIKIHECKAESLEFLNDRLYNKILFAQQLDERQKNALVEKMSNIKYRNQLCHGDYHYYNLLKNEDDVTIIDWVESSSGDVRADVCRTYLLCMQFSKNISDYYLETYCNKSGFLKNDILQWLPILAGARLTENVSLEAEKQLIYIVNQYCMSS